jgi:hypothetical protein
MVAKNISFSAIESPFFKKMINDILSVQLPFLSYTTVARRVTAEFEAC